MTATSPSMSGASGEPIGFIEPRLVRIPGQWFWMGCESGRDDEKPVHRVWVDSFELAACQGERRAWHAKDETVAGRDRRRPVEVELNPSLLTRGDGVTLEDDGARADLNGAGV